MEHFDAITPLDGRYREKLNELASLVSEKALVNYRIRVEAHWLLHLAAVSGIKSDLVLPDSVKNALESIAKEPSSDAYRKIKSLEMKTNHDVKAVEYYLREVLSENGAGSDVLAFIHFACTSEDINNLAYAMMLNDVKNKALIPQMQKILEDLHGKIEKFASIGMISRTHGQVATPTTLGKEFAVFAHRLNRQVMQLRSLNLEGKISGAVGNYNAHLVAYPNLDWPELSRRFIEDRLGLKQNPLTTQIENHDTMIEYCDILRRFNTILIGLCRDIWTYISIEYFTQRVVAGEVGSSTMPHKVNPIDFENAEGNLGIACSLSQHFAEKLPISRLQRDLSDSTVQRALGTMVGHSILAFKSLLKGLNKIAVNEDVIRSELDRSYEVLAEAVQTVMRRYGITDAYERLKDATRGEKVNMEVLERLINNCNELPDNAKKELLKLTPSTYLGCADQIARNYLK